MRALSLFAAGPVGKRGRRAWEIVRTRLVLVAIALALLVPLANPDPYVIRVLCWIGIYGLLATGLNVVVGFAGLLDLGYVAFFGLGSYTYAALASPHFEIHWPFVLGLAAAILVAGLAGVLLGIPVLPLRGDYLAIVTLGFGEIVYILLLNLDRPVNLTNGPNGILNIDQPGLLGYRVTSLPEYYYLILATLVVGVYLAYKLSVSRLGRAWVAIREDETAASAIGINTTTAKLWAFGLGASYSGAAGVLSASLQASVFPDSFLFSQSILILSMVVVGGMGSIWGALVGAAVMVLIPEVLRDLAVYRFVVVGIVLVAMMIFRPQGIVGDRRARRQTARSAETQPPVTATGPETA